MRTCVLTVVAVFAFAAASALAQDGDVPRLIEKLLRDEKAGQRKAAAKALGELGPKAKKAVPTLIAALKDVDGSVRDEAEAALTKIGEPAVADLLEAMKDPDEFVRLRVVGVIGGIGPDAKAALPILELAKMDTSSFVRDAAEEAIVRVKCDTKLLATMLKDKDDDKRMYAVRAIAYLGPHAKPLLGDLGTAFKQEKNKDIRREIPKSVGRLGRDGKDGINLLATALGDADDTVKLHAMQALAEIGPDAKAALPAIDRAAKAAQRTKNDELLDAAKLAWSKITGRKLDGK